MYHRFGSYVTVRGERRCPSRTATHVPVRAGGANVAQVPAMLSPLARVPLRTNIRVSVSGQSAAM